MLTLLGNKRKFRTDDETNTHTHTHTRLNRRKEGRMFCPECAWWAEWWNSGCPAHTPSPWKWSISFLLQFLLLMVKL